jgi:hypothetical protein
MTKVFRGFTQSLQANSGTLPLLGHNSFLHKSFQVIIHLLILPIDVIYDDVFVQSKNCEGKQPLLSNGPYTRSRGTHHVRCGVTQQLKWYCKRRCLWVRAALVAMQLCGKHISAAVNSKVRRLAVAL